MVCKLYPICCLHRGAKEETGRILHLTCHDLSRYRFVTDNTQIHERFLVVDQGVREQAGKKGHDRYEDKANKQWEGFHFSVVARLPNRRKSAIK
jgi:hypothetical protein